MLTRFTETRPRADAESPLVAESALRRVGVQPLLTVFRQLGSSPRGLTEGEADERRARLGGVEPPEPSSPLPAALTSPFVLLLSALGVVFVVLGDVRGAVTAAAMVVLSVAVRVWSQLRARRTVAGLAVDWPVTASVRRRATADAAPAMREVPVEDLVPGDVIDLVAGEVVPADVRLLSTDGLRVDQSLLSGETTPVPKTGTSPGGAVALDAVAVPSLCFAGTAVLAGRGRGVVVATGRDTYVAALERVAATARPASSADRGIRAVGWTLARCALVMVPLVVLAGGWVSGDWARAGLSAVAVAVGLVPEMLPAIVTVSAARGAAVLARRGLVVTRLDALADLGGIDVLCTDKSGTLSEGRIAFSHSIDPTGRLDDTAARYARLVTLFSTAPQDQFDLAVADCVDEDADLLAEGLYTAVEELPFDHERRRAGVVLRAAAGEHLLVTRGDPEQLLAVCSRARSGTATHLLTERERQEVAALVATHEAQGMRLLGVAVRPVRRAFGYGPDDETGLVLVGFVGFVDPLRVDAAATVGALATHGVRTVLLTGDAPRVAARVCAQAGIDTAQLVVGAQVDALPDAELAGLARRTSVFARCNPQQKARIVRALQADGSCVGYLGDGANDVPALRIADVGISVPQAVPGARAAADLMLVDPGLSRIVDGVVEGRRTLGNTMRYIKLTAAANLGNALSVLVASTVLPFLPMLPIQLMLQNLLYDTAQLALPFDRPDPHYLARPRRWDTARLARFMVSFGALSSVFDVVTFVVLWQVLALDSPSEQALFQACWFVEGLLSQLLAYFVLRSRGTGSRERGRDRPAALVAASALAATAVGLALPYSPWAATLGMSTPPTPFLPWLAAILAGYLAVATAAKVLFVRRTGDWL